MFDWLSILSTDYAEYLITLRNLWIGTSVLEVIRNAGDNHAALEEQRTFQQQRALVVKDVLPPPRRNEFGQDDCDYVVGFFFSEPVDVTEQRSC